MLTNLLATTASLPEWQDKSHLPLLQQRIQLDQQPLLILTPARAVAAELVYDGEEGFVLLNCKVCNALWRRDRGQYELVENLVHPFAHDGLVAASVGGLAHHLGMLYELI